MNKVMLIGRLTADPRMSQANGGNVARFSLAVARKKDVTDFFNCSAFDRQADFAQSYLKKGMQIGIVGRLQQNRYINKNGDNVDSVSIVVEDITFTGSKADNAEDQAVNSGSYGQNTFSNQYNTAGRQQSNYAAPNAGTNNSSMSGFMDLPDDMPDDIPF